MSKDERQIQWILGDYEGKLSKLTMTFNGKQVDLQIDKIGTANISSCLVALDASLLYVGSRFNDSQLFRCNLDDDMSDNEQGLELIDSFSSLGPMVDFTMADTEKSGQVCCRLL